MALSSTHLVDSIDRQQLDSGDWSTQLRMLAQMWEDSIHWAMTDTLADLEKRLISLSNANALPADLGALVEKARLAVEGLDAESADPAMLRQYLFNCISELLARSLAQRSRLTVHPDLNQPPRVFVVDSRQNMAIACSIQLRAFGLNALSLLDATEFEKALSRWTPAALIVVADGFDDENELLQHLRHWRSDVGPHCYCILFSYNDTLQWRKLAALAGFDQFSGGQNAYHEIGVHINAWITHQQKQEKVLLLGDVQNMESTQRVWESLGACIFTAPDLANAWPIISTERPDGIVLDVHQVRRYPELLGILDQCFDVDAIRVLEHSLAMSTQGVRVLENRREAHVETHLLFTHKKFNRLLQLERQRYDEESGLLKLEALFDRVIPQLQSRERDTHFLVCYVRFDGLEARLPVDDPLQRSYMRQAAAAALLARLAPGDWAGAVGDQNYLMVLQVTSERSLKAFSESLTHLPVAEGVKLKVGMAPIRGVNLSRAIKDAVAGLQMPQRADNENRSLGPVKKPVSHDWAMRLKLAIQEKRLYLAFQSIVSLDAEQLERYEVLLRLKEDGNSIEPREFISIARQSGLIRYLDRWVVAEALKTLKLRQGRVTTTGLFIKVSTESVLDPGFMPWMQRVIAASGVSLEHSAIEVEEDVFFSHVGEGKVFIEKMRELGVPVCISQFGRSDASLNLIDYCSPNYIKLHQQFSEKIGQDRILDMRLQELVQRAKNAGTHLLVGYLESTQALYRAVQTGAPLVQGNVLHRPSKVMEFDYSIVMKE